MSDILELGFEAVGGPVANNADKAKQKIKDAWQGQPSRNSSQQHHHHGDRQQNIQDWQYQVERENAPGPRPRGNSYESWDNWRFPPPQQDPSRRPMLQRRASSLDRGVVDYYGRGPGGGGHQAQYDRKYDMRHNYHTPNDSDSSDAHGASGRGRQRRSERRSENLRTRSRRRASRSEKDRENDRDKDRDKDRDDMSTKDKVKNKLKGHEALVAGVATVATVYAGAKFYSAYQNDKKKHDETKKGGSHRK